MMALAVLLMSSLPFAPNGRGQTKNQKGQTSIYQDSDGYEVLSVLLNAVSVVRKNDTIRIDPHTAPGKYVAEMKAQCSGIPAEFRSASEDFDKRVKSRLILQRGFSLRKNYELAYGSATAGISQPETKEEARKRIRSGIYHVAAVGFDDKRTHAVAFMEYICGNLCGDSIFYFLRKSEKGWEEAREVQREVQRCGRIY
jgi:hypothetical protein